MSHIGCTCESCREVVQSARVNSARTLVFMLGRKAEEAGCPQAARNVERYRDEIIAILVRP